MVIPLLRQLWNRALGKAACTGCGRPDPVRFCGIDREGRGMRLCVGCQHVRLIARVARREQW